MLPDCHLPETWRAKMVERIPSSTKDQRQEWICKADYNLFKLRSNEVRFDLGTDGGSGGMSDNQWSALMRGDSAATRSPSSYRLQEKVKELFGFTYTIPVHRGRAAKHALVQALLNEESIVPGNAFFDTTRANIESQKAIAIDCAIEGAFDIYYQHPFKGNVNLPELEKILQGSGSNVPMIMVSITCDKTGGQPVSMHNLREVKRLAKMFNVPVILDSARFAENAWFIQKNESEYSSQSIPDIVQEMYHHADGMVMSGKTDGLVNAGGFFATNNKDLFDRVGKYANLFCGLAGRDMEALTVGLGEVTQQEYLDDRIRQIHRFGMRLMAANVPIQQPIGGHAIVIDASLFLPLVPREEYVAKTLAVELYVEAGIRGAGMETVIGGGNPITGINRNRSNAKDFLYLAIPRQAYTNDQLSFVANALIQIFERRFTITRGLYVVHEDAILRYLTIQLKKADGKSIA
ncbi:hypothetical protein M441DRAFT_70207 [Trichoderma asperellum CBS 433.97]|uniref:Aromatic amino acid beta-eliminating lyase/threonine aldolase domain-containing protein n=1 Tax=Trichoderma asperellum (strain ATCC 204424 / CBS 433.97 / NBRC 101777) TaxID=1042311 RepID=A0A2T3Z6F7_TRIA4|nr:hypothetical protein M441DRAFT_70207 [Trichoderma asperellum CBS 433.97]PTB40406.1 hypothetical protein M441DRAFT_70207 [Trichoderma asperellum CBS 433.97]